MKNSFNLQEKDQEIPDKEKNPPENSTTNEVRAPVSIRFFFLIHKTLKILGTIRKKTLHRYTWTTNRFRIDDLLFVVRKYAALGWSLDRNKIRDRTNFDYRDSDLGHVISPILLFKWVLFLDSSGIIQILEVTRMCAIMYVFICRKTQKVMIRMKAMLQLKNQRTTQMK